MRTHFLASLIGLCSSVCGVCQPAVIAWQQCHGGSLQEEPWGFEHTADGGYVMVGQTQSNDLEVSGNHGGWDVWVVKFDADLGLQWQQCYGGSLHDLGRSIQQTSDGGYIVAGLTFSNDGDVSGSHGLGDFWIIKLDNSGTLEWQRCLGGSALDVGEQVEQTIDGGYIVTGQTRSFDGDVVGIHSALSDAWVVKLDADGNLEWKRCLGGTGQELFVSIHQFADGTYVLTSATSSNDGDLSPGPVGALETWFVRLDQTGGITWQTRIDGHGGPSDRPSINATSDGGYVLVGQTSCCLPNYHPGSGGTTPPDYWIAKVDQNGQLQWEKCYGGTGSDQARSVQQTSDGGYLVIGQAASTDGDVVGSFGVDPGDWWVIKLDATGELQWQKCMGGTAWDFGIGLLLTSEGEYLCTGYTFSTDGDVACSAGTGDCWIVKLTDNFNGIYGRVFIDLNSNSIQDLGEIGVQHLTVHEANTGRIGFSDQMGDYDLSVLQSGSFSVLPAGVQHFNSAPNSQAVVFTGLPESMENVDFAFQPNGSVTDLSVAISPTTLFRPGQMAHYVLSYENAGNNVLTPTLVFRQGTDLTYWSASVAPTTITTDSVTWALPSLAPFENGQIDVQVYVSTSAFLGEQISSSAMIFPVLGDVVPDDNASTWTITVAASLDPNVVLVDKATISSDDVVDGTPLDYVIQFQNTGTDTAFTVLIKNPLPLYVDPVSLEFVTASHAVELNFNNDTREMLFLFNNILLPDSNTNEAGSHGFARYRVKPLTSLTLGDSISEPCLHLL
ncbi:MAG: hypothetical protein IPP83_16205 [Flavobacteriales bacterium]|nr:hypothetical protein [Flavobacteriales bacterium]